MDGNNGQVSWLISPSTSEGDACVMRLAGELASQTCGVVQDALAPLLDTLHGACLVLDLSLICAIDAAGLILLAGLLHTLRQRGATLRLRGCRPCVRRALEDTFLIHLFDILS